MKTCKSYTPILLTKIMVPNTIGFIDVITNTRKLEKIDNRRTGQKISLTI